MGFSLGGLNPFKSGSVFEQAAQGVSSGLTEVDKTVNREIPGGWVLPAAIAAAYATGYIDPSLFASEAAATSATEAGAGTIASEAGSQAFFTALAEGATSADAVAAGLAADAAAGVTAGAATEAAINPATGLPWEATGSGFAGNGVQLTPAEFATQAGTSGTSVADALRTANSAKNVFNTLSNLGKTSSPQALAAALQATQTPMEQFGGLYRMNEKPFLQQQTASISPDSYNVSGQNIASPIAPTNQLLANLLYPKA